VSHILAKCEHRPAVIGLAGSADETEVIRARQAGITELVSYEHPEHLRMVFDNQAGIIRQRHSIGRLERKVRDGEARCQTLIENSSDAIAYLHEGMHVYANPPYLRLFGIETPEEIEGIPMLDMISSDAHERFRELLKHDLDKADRNTTIEIECVSRREGSFSCSMECSPASMAGEPCTQIRVRVHEPDPALEEQVRTLSQQDMLTGLLNRQYFMKVLGQRIRDTAQGCSRALVYLTLDNFKVIRDEVGIADGDVVLCDVAGLIARHRSPEDLLARFGDYSFVLFKQEHGMDAIQQAAEALCRDIAGHLAEASGRSFSLTASIGICEVNAHTRDVQQLVAYADMACEVARTSGGNRIHVHSTVISDSMDPYQEGDWERIVDSTIEDDRCHLVFQPIVSLRGDITPRYEALLRILDENGQTIQPLQFVTIAEKYGKGGDIDRCVIDRACRELAALRTSGNRAAIYVKLTGHSIADGDMPAWIHGKLQEHGLDSSSIVLEISEQLACIDVRTTLSFVAAVQKLGFRVALEHVGRNGKLQILNHVPADIIKIDKTLITGLANDPAAQETVRAIMEIAKQSGKPCIAVNVEDSRCLARLWQLGMHYIQGNFIQEPVRALGYVFESEIA
jgi:diguanylate cyclase (GGDEF)-like protein/PAS domain S-box-containing protein